MSDVLWKITGGYVYDPLNGVDGQVQDIWIQGGKIVSPPGAPQVPAARTLNAAGLVVMPGGIDMHCHIAGPKVNAARKLRPEERRGANNVVRRTALTHSGTLGSVPSTFGTGYKYIGLGYTTAFDAAVPPLMARHAHEEFEDMPCIDKGFYVNEHPNISVDVGQILFGETTSMTGDGPLGYYMHNVYGGKWFSADVEMEAGCGIAPIKYRNQSLIHAWQWAIGLEWYLLVQDPWRVVMSTDSPNGASFLAYPQIIRLLMDRTYRKDVLKDVHATVGQNSVLADLDREYSLSDIAIITRAGPAKLLGLKHKGHLGPGADADVTIYTPHENKELMFQLPRYVIKSGRLLVEDGDLRETLDGKTLYAAPGYDADMERLIGDWFEQYYSVRFRNYPVGDDYLHAAEQVACG